MNIPHRTASKIGRLKTMGLELHRQSQLLKNRAVFGMAVSGSFRDVLDLKTYRVNDRNQPSAVIRGQNPNARSRGSAATEFAPQRA